MEIKFSNLDSLKAEFEKSLKTNGYFIKTEETLQMRSTVMLVFMLENAPARLELKTEVIFIGQGGYGLTFVESQEKLRFLLSEFEKKLSSSDQSQSQVQQPQPPVTEPHQQQTQQSVQTQPHVTPPTQPITQQPQITPPVQQAVTQQPQVVPNVQQPVQSQAVPPPQPVPPPPVQVHSITGKMINALKIDSKKKAGEVDHLADFGDMSFSKILLNINEGKTTGIITLKGPEIEKVVYFRKGRPVFVDSNPPLVDESIGNILLTKGKIKKEQLDQAISYVEEHGVRIGEAMMALKLVSPTLLKDALTFQLKIKLYELFKWQEADFEMKIMPSLGQKFGTRPINVISVIYKGLKEKLKDLYPADLEQYISPIYDKYLIQKNPLPFDIENLGFNTNEKRFWTLLLNGKRRVRQIFEGSTMNKPDTFRFLYALLELDLVNINDQQTLDIPNIERDLYNQSRNLERMDLFTILGVHWSGSTEKIEIAYKKRMEQHKELYKIPDLSDKAKQDIQKIADFYKKAYEHLIDITKRREYRKEVLGETEAKICAELAAKQAQLMEFRGDMKEARELIEVALELNPTSGEYRLLLKKYGGKIAT